MKKTPIEQWTPSDGLKLELNALEAARSDYNALVIAGPGAGKTELLAQRASYLLQTGMCQFPKKILAISFKKDAAHNLKERVNLRCGESLSKRFESMTFDAFSVNLLMRFHNAQPDRYKIKGTPQVVLSDNPMLDEFKYQAPDLFNRVKKDDLLNYCYHKLPQATDHEHAKIRDAVWMAILAKTNPRLPLKMIMRLSNLIIDRNPLIKSYLRNTYQQVFLDEFQDTTYIQYEFLNACFFGSQAVLTAVGDNKQRIMVWAGAKPSAFEDFVKDTAAKEIRLFMNFRSAPRLVALQNFFVEKLLGKNENAEAAAHWNVDDGECFLWEYQRQQQEAEHLFATVKQWIEVDGLDPREICMLVKQTPDVGARDIIAHFNANGIKVRNETDLQNLITEDLVLFIAAMLYSAADRRYSKERLLISEQMQIFSGVKEQAELLHLEGAISKFQRQLKAKISKTTYTLDDVSAIIDEIVAFAGEQQIKSTFIEYKDEAYFKFILKNFSALLLKELANNSNMPEAVDSCMGKDSIPIMTVHKSKGLEYHSIIFVGLEDSAFWSYSKQPEEDKCTFFVALSRAERRIIFTFSHQRADKFRRVQPQAADNIKELWDSLEESGIAVREVIV